MNKHHLYNAIVERKIEQQSVVDADHLWDDMHAILDKKMPQKKDRRPFIFWVLNNRVSLTMALILLVAGSSILLLSVKERTIATIKQEPTSLMSEQLINRNAVKDGAEHNEKKTAEEPKQLNKGSVSATKPFSSPQYETSNYNINGAAPINSTKKLTIKDHFGESSQVISKAGADFYAPPVRLGSIPHDFSISTNQHEGLDSLIMKAELMTNNVKPNNRKNNESGFYAGVMLGIDLSSIHFQSVKTGSTKGFIIGYAINNKWSVESGLLADTKRVYDNGSYFNPAGYTPTNGITIVAVNGKSRLYEWPINLKYTVISGRHNLFATTGLSSYFMKSENYDYEYKQSNQPGGHNYLNYTNETRNWFSVLNFSLGYTHKLGAAGTFRIEPYLKVPIKNIGVGNMPILSTGLNVGFTKQIR